MKEQSSEPMIICPFCRSVEWNVHSREELSCDKCGHRWVPRGGCRPTMCPKCKTHYWMDPAKEAVAAREEQLVTALTMYSEGKGCFEISMSTGAPLESLILRIRELHDGSVRMTTSKK